MADIGFGFPNPRTQAARLVVEPGMAALGLGTGGDSLSGKSGHCSNLALALKLMIAGFDMAHLCLKPSQIPCLFKT
jgi:hypothetical protein